MLHRSDALLPANSLSYNYIIRIITGARKSKTVKLIYFFHIINTGKFYMNDIQYFFIITQYSLNVYVSLWICC